MSRHATKVSVGALTGGMLCLGQDVADLLELCRWRGTFPLGAFPQLPQHRAACCTSPGGGSCLVQLLHPFLHDEMKTEGIASPRHAAEQSRKAEIFSQTRNPSHNYEIIS